MIFPVAFFTGAAFFAGTTSSSSDELESSLEESSAARLGGALSLPSSSDELDESSLEEVSGFRTGVFLPVALRGFALPASLSESESEELESRFPLAAVGLRPVFSTFCFLLARVGVCADGADEDPPSSASALRLAAAARR